MTPEPTDMIPELGVIEGFYGAPWSWEERADTVDFIAACGYGFYLYAPKAERALRRGWKDGMPEETVGALRMFSTVCADAGVRFGVGLSPWGVFLDSKDEARSALARKVESFDAVGVRDFALLFDDMTGPSDGLAERQVELAEFVRETTSADRMMVCPSYYSDDPVLDQVFGPRPDGYLSDLGRGLHPATEILWTGPEVVSRQISPGHVRRVSEELGRRPFLWDNYPVNDGQRMCEFLHLRGFTGRPSALAGTIAGHGVNPALQPTLSRIPLATLPDVYRHGDDYEYSESFRRAAVAVLGPRLGEWVREDLLQLQDAGRHRLSGEKEERLRSRYGGVDHDGAREIVRWLDGAYTISDEAVRTQ